MEVRILEDRDTKRYTDLRMQASRKHPRGITRDLERELFLFANYPRAVISQHSSLGTTVWGAYDSRMLAGTLAVSRRFNAKILSYLWLWGLYVVPRYRGTPVSRLLMEEMLSWCKHEPSGQRLLSSYHATNEEGWQFLSRWGFEPVPGDTFSSNSAEREFGCVVVERELE